MKRLLLAAALALLSGAAPAQRHHSRPPARTAAPAATTPAATPPIPGHDTDANPALWVVRDDDTTIYLFGTIHLLDGRSWFNDEIKTAFDASDELVLEAVLPENPMEAAPLIMGQAVDHSGVLLSSRLTPAENAALATAAAPLHLPPAALDRFKPWFVSMMLSTTAAQRAGMASAQGPEAVLSQEAHARHMRIGQLESIQWQVSLFDNLPMPFQMAGLRGTLRELGAMDRTLVSLVTAWSAGDVAALQRALNDPTENPTMHRILLTNRNAAWARWIQNRLQQPGKVFIAVGAAHLAGPDSVLVQLHGRGIEAARVPHTAGH